MDDNAATITEDLGGGISRIWLEDRRVVVFVARKPTREAADVWSREVLMTARTWSRERPFLALHDFRQMSITPYNMYRAEETAKQFPSDISGRYCILVSSDFLGRSIKMIGSSRLRKYIPNLESQFSFFYDEALNWLKEKLET